MKKYFLLSVGMLLFSCSNDDTQNVINTTGPSTKTIKSITDKTYSNQIMNESVLNFSYLNGKLEKVSFSNGQYERLYYDNNKISKIEKYSSSDVVLMTYNFFYNGTKLAIITDSETQRDFNYYEDEIKSVSYLDMNTDTTVNHGFGYQNGNIISFKIEAGIPIDATLKMDYEFDTMYNYYSLLNSYYALYLSSQQAISKNNCLNEYIYDATFTTKELAFKNEITYDSDNYPVSIKRYDVRNKEVVLVSERIIEYN